MRVSRAGGLLSFGGAAREVAGVGNAPRADTLQLYLRWGKGAPGGRILDTAGIGLFFYKLLVMGNDKTVS